MAIGAATRQMFVIMGVEAPSWSSGWGGAEDGERRGGVGVRH